MFYKKYESEEKLRDRLVGRYIVEWNKDKLVLDDGAIVTCEETEQDCCARADGDFSDVKLEAVITDVRYEKPVSVPDNDTTISTREIVFIHNQNPIGKANLCADGGNGGYYYSVVAIKIGDIYYEGVSDTDGYEED